MIVAWEVFFAFKLVFLIFCTKKVDLRRLFGYYAVRFLIQNVPETLRDSRRLGLDVNRIFQSEGLWYASVRRLQFSNRTLLSLSF